MKRTIYTFAGRALALPAILIYLTAFPWTVCCAAEPVTVCILDSGCSEDHVEGESFLGAPDDLTDPIGHGTSICSLVRSGAPEAKVVMLKCFESQDTVNEEAIISALYAAVDTYHADVINISWTVNVESEALHEAIVYAYEKGSILVAATGNLSLQTPLGSTSYPAGWEEVIGVGAVNLDEDGNPASSLWYLQSDSIFVCADGSWQEEKGTSYAAPKVAAMIAGFLQSAPEEEKNDAGVREYLKEQAQDLGESGYDTVFGWGYIAEN